jgi:hypothetical protein
MEVVLINDYGLSNDCYDSSNNALRTPKIKHLTIIYKAKQLQEKLEAFDWKL